jgi:aerobic carbon-monoxide dehydrogenase large subunit
VQNAVIDALSYLGVRHLDMALTPERIWTAIEDAKNGRPVGAWSDPPAAMNAKRAGADGPSAEDLEAASGI